MCGKTINNFFVNPKDLTFTILNSILIIGIASIGDYSCNVVSDTYVTSKWYLFIQGAHNISENASEVSTICLNTP